MDQILKPKTFGTKTPIFLSRQVLLISNPSRSACSIRLSAVPLDPDLPVSVTYEILYAATAPDDILTEEEDRSTEAGSVRFSDSSASPTDDMYGSL